MDTHRTTLRDAIIEQKVDGGGMTNSVIEYCIPPRPFSHGHLAEIYGYDLAPDPAFYRHLEDGREFSHIAAGLGWPAPSGKPGYACIMGIGRPKDAKDEKTPQFYMLDEAEEKSLRNLLDACIAMRDKWGFWQAPNILRLWTGDPEKFLTFYSQYSTMLTKKHDNNSNAGFYLVPPHDWDAQNSHEIYLHRLFASIAAKKSQGKEGAIELGDCEILRRYLANLPVDVAKKQPDDYPPILAVGGLIHNFHCTKPWMQHVEVQRSIDTFAMEVEREYELTIRYLEQIGDEEYGEETPMDLIPTVG